MVPIYLFNNAYHVGEDALIDLLGMKPYILKQVSNGLQHRQEIEQPYKLNGGYYHSEAGFIQLANHLTITPEHYETVISSFHHAKEARKRKGY